MEGVREEQWLKVFFLEMIPPQDFEPLKSVVGVV